MSKIIQKEKCQGCKRMFSLDGFDIKTDGHRYTRCKDCRKQANESMKKSRENKLLNRKKIHNNITITHPWLNNEWDFDKNVVDIKTVSYGCSLKVWWICNKNHSYEASVYHRTGKNPRGCPYCGGKKISEDNCLATTHPELAKEWDYNKNKIKPEEITHGSGKKVWWICDKGHSYICSILNRTNKCGCPFCNQSKGEKRIETFLRTADFPYECQKKFIYMFGLSRLKFVYDFFLIINNIKILIEFDGGQHFEEIEFFHREKSFKKQQLIDLLKTSYAHQNNFCILRICYKDIDKIEKILGEFIDKIKNKNKRIHKMNKKYYQNHIDLIKEELVIIPI